MKVIIVNKRKAGVTVIIIGLMLVLLGLEQQFDERLKFVALLQNNITSLKKYEEADRIISYKLPSEWTVIPQKFSGSEILYHNEFTSEDSIIHGFVEVLNLRGDIETFLEKSKEELDKYSSDNGYNISTIKINSEDGYLQNYMVVSNATTKYKAYEYLIEGKEKIFRFSFFVRESNFKETMPTIFKTIVETMQHNE